MLVKSLILYFLKNENHLCFHVFKSNDLSDGDFNFPPQSFASSVFVNTFHAFCLEITESILDASILASCAHLLSEAGAEITWKEENG